MMHVTKDFWISTATRVPLAGGSHMGTRRFLVVHYTAGGTAASSINWWKNPKAKGANAHFVIDRDGKLFQCRPLNRTCGHAGVSRWKDPKTGVLYTNLNSCSIGIEMANGGDTFPTKFSKLDPVSAKHKHQPKGPARQWESYTPEQIATVKELTKILKERFNIDDVIGHEDIAPTRKTDPGPAFPMQELREHVGLKGLPTMS